MGISAKRIMIITVFATLTTLGFTIFIFLTPMKTTSIEVTILGFLFFISAGLGFSAVIQEKKEEYDRKFPTIVRDDSDDPKERFRKRRETELEAKAKERSEKESANG